MPILTMILMFFLMGTPMAVAFTIIVPTGLYYWVNGVPLVVLPQKIANAAQIFPLLAIPFFVLAGSVMNAAGITDRLVRFANVLVGRFTGGLGHVVVVTNLIMAGISGSAAADAAATGSVLVPVMIKRGYTPAFTAAIIAAAATAGPIVPPSIPLVIFGAVAEVSTSRLLLGGVIPGLLLGAYLMAANYLVAKRRGYPREDPPTWGDVFRATVKALPALGLPFIIVGGIVLGAITPTEAGVVAAVYALVLGLFIYRTLKLRDLWAVAARVSTMVAAIVFLIGATNILGDVITREQIDQSISSFFLGFSTNPMIVLLMVNIMLLILGIPLEPIPLMLIFIPTLVPLVAKIGVDPVHFGVVMVLNLMIGLITPPVGMIMFLLLAMAKCSMWEFTKEIIPFFIAMVIVLFLITYIPNLVLWLPNTLLGARPAG